MEIGDIVAPKDEKFPELFNNKFVLHSGSETYNKAIVVDTKPLVLVSEHGDMRWESTIDERYFEVIGKASPSLLEWCMKRKLK